MENKKEKVAFTTKIDKDLLKKFKHFCLSNDKNVNYYIEKMMVELLEKDSK